MLQRILDIAEAAAFSPHRARGNERIHVQGQPGVVDGRLRTRCRPSHRERAIHRAFLEKRFKVREEILAIDLRLGDTGFDGDHDRRLDGGCAGKSIG